VGVVRKSTGRLISALLVYAGMSFFVVLRLRFSFRKTGLTRCNFFHGKVWQFQEARDPPFVRKMTGGSVMHDR
jgi:hypothetical protein